MSSPPWHPRCILGGVPSTPDVPIKVLVVEDDAASREVLTKAVCLFGYACRCARDGLEAWEMHQAEHADVILSDWQMPRMDGLELCRRTRAVSDDDAYTHFIFMTAFKDKEHFLRGMEAGADDYHTKPVDLDELRARLHSASRVVALHRKLEEKNAVLRRDSQVSFRAARVDHLTDIANRLGMTEDLASIGVQMSRSGRHDSIAICDIDRFKQYNDGFGHLAGDDALRRLAAAIRLQLRDTDGLYRYGGEEFVMLFPGQSLARAMRAAERVRRAVLRLGIPMPDQSSVLSVSIGVAEFDVARDATTDDWLRRADAALYRAKAGGRNRVEGDRWRLAGDSAELAHVAHGLQQLDDVAASRLRRRRP